jgi:hypothetical protein
MSHVHHRNVEPGRNQVVHLGIRPLQLANYNLAFTQINSRDGTANLAPTLTHRRATLAANGKEKQLHWLVKRREQKLHWRLKKKEMKLHWRQAQKRISGVGFEIESEWRRLAFEIESEWRRLALMGFKSPIIPEDLASQAWEPKLPQPYIWPQARGAPNRRRPTWRRRPLPHSHPGHITPINYDGFAAIFHFIDAFLPQRAR